MQALQARPKFAKATMPRTAARKQIVCAASKPEEVQTRRAALALFAGLVVGAGVVEEASANLGVAKNSSVGSMSAYDLEGGIKKQGIKAGRRKKLLAKVRANAEKESSKGK